MTDAPYKSAQVMGADHNLTAVEMNFLLKDEGFLYGGPGAYGLTAKGEQYANERYVSPGPRSTYVQTTWNPQTTDELDLSDDRKREIRDAVAAARRQKAEQRAADAYDPDAAADGEERSGPDPLLVAAVGAAPGCVSASSSSSWIATSSGRGRSPCDTGPRVLRL